MEISFNETKLYKFHPKLWSYVILFLISLAFLISDWTILYSSFGDFLLVISIFLILFLGKVHITKKQLIILLASFIIIAITFILSYYFNDYWFNLRRATLSSIKSIFYLVFLVISYNFIKDNHLSLLLLKISNILAIITIMIGLVITISIYLDNNELPNFIWTFTRQDSQSYYFAGNDAIVRTRSFFSEPAHLGYYLNTLFFSNVLYEKAKNNKIVLFLLLIGIILTLSYSMIAIFLVTFLSLVTVRIIKGDFMLSKWYMVPFFILVSITLYFWDFVDVTIIERTKNIISGEDGSANIRLLGSWMYVEKERLLYGNGIGHTPPVTNIFAYLMSDFGLIGFIPYLGLTVYVILSSIPTAVLFITMNMAKGGYLNPSFWLFLLFVFLYGIAPSIKLNKINELKGKVYV